MAMGDDIVNTGLEKQDTNDDANTKEIPPVKKPKKKRTKTKKMGKLPSDKLLESTSSESVSTSTVSESRTEIKQGNGVNDVASPVAVVSNTDTCVGVGPSRIETKRSSELDKDSEPAEEGTGIKKEEPQEEEDRKNPIQLESPPKPIETGKKKTKNRRSKGKKKPNEVESRKLTEFFLVRRSSRKPESELKKELKVELEDKILSVCEDGLSIQETALKGRGIITTKTFGKGEFVVEYKGDLIDIDVAKQRNAQYDEGREVGSYMYYFKHQERNYW